MTTLGDLCEKYFGARNFYDVLKIPTTASEKEVKKAYYKISLLVHPDRVEEGIKEEATEKFKVLGIIHSILSDKDKRKIYDECGHYDEESEEVLMQNWADAWKTLFRPLTVEDISKYESMYKGSDTEIKDLKVAYLDGKGDMDHILISVPFTNCDDEPRIHEIIQTLIDSGDVPEYKAFTQENEKKKERRRRKWAREAEEAERQMKLKNIVFPPKGSSSTSDLAVAIQERNKARQGESESFFESLVDKYCKKARKPAKAKAKTVSRKAASASGSSTSGSSTKKSKKNA